MRPNVLVMSQWYPSPTQPHAYPFVRDWARVAARIARVRVLHLNSQEHASLGCNMVQETDPSITGGLETWRIEMGHGSRIRPTVLRREIHAVMRALRTIGPAPDIVHGHVFTIGAHALACRIRYGIPYVVTEHFSRYLREDFLWYHRLQAITTLAPAARIVPVSGVLGRAMRQRGVRGRFETIPNPVDTELFSAAPLPSSHPLRLVSVGNLVRQKRIDLLIRALVHVRQIDVALTVIGDGPQRSELEALAGALGLDDRVHFLGSIPRHEVARQLEAAHALVVSSALETFSVAAVEALASGRPVLTTRCGGPESFIGPAEGVVVERGNSEALATGIVTLRKRLDADEFEPARLARSVQTRFSTDAVANQLEHLYRDVLAERA